MKVNGSIEGKMVDHQELDIIPLPQLQCWSGELAVHKDHLPGHTCRCPVLPCQREIEAHRVSGGPNVETAAVGPGDQA